MKKVKPESEGSAIVNAMFKVQGDIDHYRQLVEENQARLKACVKIWCDLNNQEWERLGKPVGWSSPFID